MGQYKLDIRGFLHHFKRLLVLEDLADMGEQVKVCIADTGLIASAPRRTLAAGAVTAAEFLCGKRGVFGMDDLLQQSK